MFINIVDQPIKPEEVIAQAKTSNSGCVVTSIGLIRTTRIVTRCWSGVPRPGRSSLETA